VLAVVLLVGRYADMAEAAAEVLAPLGHRCVAVLDPDAYESRVSGLEHDIVVLGPSLAPPERDHIEAVSLVSRSTVPVVHVRTIDEAIALADLVGNALDGVPPLAE
jgi:DNA-binding MurR/RpiR family transcriptional regulator